MLEGAVDDVCDRLEAAVRVPGGALGLARRVLDLAHLIHVDERVQLGHRDAGKRAANREALTLVAGRRVGDRPNVPLRRIGRRLRDPSQCGDVRNRHGWHGRLLEVVERSIVTGTYYLAVEFPGVT